MGCTALVCLVKGRLAAAFIMVLFIVAWACLDWRDFPGWMLE
jgi:hypothetical protein